MKDRVIFYIDGLNLYNGLKTARLRNYYWLNLEELAKKLITQNQRIIRIKYFTSMVSSIFDQQKFFRQQSYIKVLKTIKIIEIFFGRHQRSQTKCKNCNKVIKNFNEKMTDVNIAVEMLKDAYSNNCDVQILISGDSDLIPICNAIKNDLQTITLIIYFPPKRQTDRMKNYCHSWKSIYLKTIKDSQFPYSVLDLKGFTISKPTYWS
jgi:uncharacterized LabA/DUF88 family protein